MITLALPGWAAGEKVDEKIVNFDLNQAKDIGAPGNLGGVLSEFVGKIQPSVNGNYMNVSYELWIIAEIDGCICWSSHPFVYTPIEILAPERVLAFQQDLYGSVPTGHGQVPIGIPPPGSQVIAPAEYTQAPAPNGEMPVPSGQTLPPKGMATIAGPSDYIDSARTPILNPEAPVREKGVKDV